MDRKSFLITSTFTAVGLSVFGSVFRKENGEFASDCETTNDILGPFYRPDAPLIDDLTYDGLEGTRIVIKGKVYQSDCSTIIKNALVEIWHANTKGEYDNESSEFQQRAGWKTNDKGEYSFKTIMPGKIFERKIISTGSYSFQSFCRWAKGTGFTNLFQR